MIRYLCPYWGSEHKSAKEFLRDALADGYTGVEINLPDEAIFVSSFCDELKHIRETIQPDFIFVAQQVLPNKKESWREYQSRMMERLAFLLSLKPNAVNSHTGKDFFEFSENVALIENAEQLSTSSGIPIWHEIHRGRFSFHLKTLLRYLSHFAHLKLVADFSHFCVVSESMLEEQQDDLALLYPHIAHLHARVGFEQSPQVNHPFAPEWQAHLARYLYWWKSIIAMQQEKINFTITPEFGPFPYMPQEPFTTKPLAHQQTINNEMKKFLEENL